MAKFIAPSEYLSAADLPPNEDLTVTIRSYAEESLYQDGRTKTKPVLGLDGVPGRFTINRGNGKILCELFGDETDHWLGRKISLFVDHDVQFNDKRVGGIRIRPYLVD